MKKALNEQISRIKEMMKKITNESYDYDAEEENYITQQEDLENRLERGEIDKKTFNDAMVYLEDNHYDFWMDGLGIDYVLSQVKNDEPNEEEPPMCGCCNGTGEERDESRCTCCGGSGVKKRERDDFEPPDNDRYDSGYDDYDPWNGR